MTKILKFPNRMINVATKKKFMELSELLDELNIKDKDYDTSLHAFIKKVRKFDEYLDVDTKSTKEMIQGFIDAYKAKIDNLEKLKK